MAEIKIIDYGKWRPDARGKVLVRRDESEEWLDISSVVCGYSAEMNLDSPTHADIAVGGVETEVIAELWEIAGMRKLEGPKLLNINTRVKVKLTELGIRVYRVYYQKYRGHAPRVDEEGYTELNLYEVMSIFGTHLFLGATNLPFNTNMKIEGEDLKEPETGE